MSATMTVLTSSAAVSPLGANVELTAAITPFGGADGGTVAFYDGSTLLGRVAVSPQNITDPRTGAVSVQGFACLQTNSLAVGAHSLTADYGGDSNCAPSNSLAITVTIYVPTGRASSIALSASSSIAQFGSSVTLTATVNPIATSGGTVTFYDGGVAIGTGILNSSGVASMSSTTLAVGAHSLTANYGGSGTYAASVSAALALTIVVGLTLGTVPGFVDLPDALLAANKYAMGLYFQRILDNAKFGIVRPEVFVAQYKHGDTVNLPTSTVDGYAYERDELIYLWHFVWTGGVTSTSVTDPVTGAVTNTLTANTPAGPGSIWYFEAFVDQGTGAVSSYVKYRNSGGTTDAKMSNDGMVEVITIGVRRMSSLIVSSVLPAWSDLPDSTWAEDAAVTETLTLALNRNAKLASLRHEAIYMGEFTNGQQVPMPISPADGYAYSSSEVTFAWSWRWCSMTAAFGDPTGWHGDPGKCFNQLQRVVASVDANGHVSTQVVFYDSGELSTNYGRLTVVAFCQRHPISVSAEANAFTDIDDSNLISGAFPKLDVFKALDDAIRFAALRVEYFTANCTNGQTVPLPTSPVDGYAYARSELTYHYDFGTTGPNTDIRLVSFGASINQSTGLVQTVTNHLHDGGGFKAATNGTVHVTIIARRSHVHPAITDASIAVDGGGGEADTGINLLANGGFESWSRALQTVADAWSQGDIGGGASFSQATGIDGSSAQGLSVPAAVGRASVYSAPFGAKAGDQLYCKVSVASDAATSNGFYFRVWLYNADSANSCYFDLLPNFAMQGAGQYEDFALNFTVPTKNAASAVTTLGSAAIMQPYDFTVSKIRVELYVLFPSAAVNVILDSASVTPYQPGADVSYENVDVLLRNPNFVNGCNGWYPQGGWAVVPWGNPGGGSNSAQFLGGTAAITNAQNISCVAGSVIAASCYCTGSPDATGVATPRINFYNSAGAYLSTAQMGGIPPNVPWASFRIVGTAPAGTAYAQIDFAVYGRTAGVWYVAGFSASLLPNSLDEVPDSVTFKKLGSTWVTGTGTLTIGSGTPLNGQGSIIPNQAIAVNYSYTSSSITLSWAAQSMKRTDGSYLNLQAGSIVYGGLGASTAYYIYPYIQTFDGSMQFTNGNPPPTGPNVYNAFDCALDGRVPVSPIVVTTAAVSSPTGGGGTGGGWGLCPEQAELVEIDGKGQVAAGTVCIGDSIKGKSLKSGADVFRKIIGLRLVPSAAWRIIDAHRVSPCEAVYDNGGWVAAYMVARSTFDSLIGQKVEITVESDEYDESNYYLVSGTALLVHNMRMDPC